MNQVGRRVFGAAAIGIGVIGLCWGQLTGVWQPTPEIAEGWTPFPYIVAALFLAGGIAVQAQRTERAGALLLSGLFLFFALLWVRRIVLLPLVFGTWGGCAEQVAPALAGLLIAFRREWPEPWNHVPALVVSRIGFAICAIAFGFNHFFSLQLTAAMVPQWLPPSQTFWAIATGLADVAAGCAILSMVLPVLAARLLTLLFASYSAFIWLPELIANPADHAAWAGNAVNLALISAVWVLADALAVRARAGAQEGPASDQENGGRGKD